MKISTLSDDVLICTPNRDFDWMKRIWTVWDYKKWLFTVDKEQIYYAYTGWVFVTPPYIDFDSILGNLLSDWELIDYESHRDNRDTNSLVKHLEWAVGNWWKEIPKKQRKYLIPYWELADETGEQIEFDV
jgi:hypothetical protein